jgi:LysR family glycine cleavage system transcriptional activator
LRLSHAWTAAAPGAISHQIRGLEALLGVQLFERRVRAIVLTAAGKLLYPGVQTGFVHLREAVRGSSNPTPRAFWW